MEPVTAEPPAEGRLVVSIVIPALNEEEPIGEVVRAVAAQPVDEIIVVDNGSTDRTAEHAAAAGARVVCAPRRGYGRACRAGATAVRDDCAVIVFLDGDGSDCPEFIPVLVAPILDGHCDFVIGSRVRGRAEAGSLTLQQRLAGRLAGSLCRLAYGVRYTDMSPFRAIRREWLRRLGLREQTYGWNLEMQMQAARLGLRILEIPVDHRCRAGGVSKVSGTLAGTTRAAVRIALTFLRVMAAPPVAGEAARESRLT
jgi:glycosyltransferase involved in cell wall biosynthesis